ncbi:MAG: glycosyltransferase [Proteobacteria bacterium]|nr:glycosyltransferase [Pseudomonadota bacterium]
MDGKNLQREFLQSKRSHILMVTNHGTHTWEVRSGLTDTGGQNQYVRSLSDALVALGYRVTTYNRGGYPDPMSGEILTGARYRDSHSRIVYLEGGGGAFIRKEDLTREILSDEVEFAKRLADRERLPVDLIISHYWDGALLACILKEESGLKAKHIWVPHSLGTLKRLNFMDKPPEVVAPLRFDERIAFEKEVMKAADAVASTSGDISRHSEKSYGRRPELFLPPCIDTSAIRPLDEGADLGRIYEFLKETDPATGRKASGRRCVLEMSRTDRTKRKDIVLKAFAEARRDNPDALLLLRINRKANDLFAELDSLARELGVRDDVVYVGMVPDDLMAQLFAISTVYLSPSEMEGFGMSVQEAAACRKATISSTLIPFAVEYLAKDGRDEIVKTRGGDVKIRWGKGGVIVPAGAADGFAHALKALLADAGRRESIAAAAYDITIPYFTWDNMTRMLLSGVGMKAARPD